MGVPTRGSSFRCWQAFQPQTQRGDAAEACQLICVNGAIGLLRAAVQSGGSGMWLDNDTCTGAGPASTGSCPLCGVRLPLGPALDSHVAAELEELDKANWQDVVAGVSGDTTYAEWSRPEASDVKSERGGRSGTALHRRCMPSVPAAFGKDELSMRRRALAPVASARRRCARGTDTALGLRHHSSAVMRHLGTARAASDGRRRRARDADTVCVRPGCAVLQTSKHGFSKC